MSARALFMRGSDSSPPAPCACSCLDVGWIEPLGIGHVVSYRISGYGPSSIRQTGEELQDVSVTFTDKIMTVTFTRPIGSSGDADGPENARSKALDLSEPMPVMWALFPAWSVRPPPRQRGSGDAH